MKGPNPASIAATRKAKLSSACSRHRTGSEMNLSAGVNTTIKLAAGFYFAICTNINICAGAPSTAGRRDERHEFDAETGALNFPHGIDSPKEARRRSPVRSAACDDPTGTSPPILMIRSRRLPPPFGFGPYNR
jgi:hypothetical protein